MVLPTQHNTTQHNTTQHNTTQHNTTQHNYKLNKHRNHKELRYITMEAQHLKILNAVYLYANKSSYINSKHQIRNFIFSRPNGDRLNCTLESGRLFEMPRGTEAKSVLEAARQLGSEAAKRDLDVKTQRSEDAKSVSEATKQLRSEAAKCNILISPLEGEKKFLGELCELRNFREGYKKYKNLDRATECAMTNVSDKKGKIKMNENNLQQKQSNSPAAFSKNKHSLLADTVFSRFTSHVSRKRIAFTLAEVLITLGIIGVVAALTLPNLIANYQKKNLVTQLKKSVSTIEQGFTTMLADEGVESLADTDVFKAINGSCIASEGLKNSGCNDFYPKLKKYFNIIDVRETGSDFKHRNIKPNASFQNPDNRTDGAMIVLADGAILYSYNISSSEQKSPYSCDYIHSKGGTMCAKMGNFAIDVNGKKKPNVTGRDVFVFYISSTGHLVPLWSKNDLIYAEGNDRRSWIYNSSACGTYGKADAEEKATYGTGCAARIIENGWEMDY